MEFAQLVGRPGDGPASAARPGGRRLRTAAASAVDPIAARGALESLEKCLVAAIVVQAQKRPSDRDGEAGDRPPRLAGTGGQAVAECETQRQVGGVVHQVIEINAVQADRSPPAGDLAVDVVEPEAQVGQQDARRRRQMRSPVPIATAAASDEQSAARVTWWALKPSRIASQQP